MCFHLAKLKMYLFYNSSSALSQPLATTLLLWASMNLPTLRTSCKWDHTAFVFSWLVCSSMLQHISEFPFSLRLNNISLYEQPHFVYLSVGTWVISAFWLWWTASLWTRVYKYLSKSLLSFFFNIYIYLAVPSLNCGMWDLVPWPGSNPGSLHWACRALVTGLRGKSSLKNSFGYILRSGIAGLWVILFNYLRSAELLAIPFAIHTTMTTIPIPTTSAQGLQLSTSVPTLFF